MKLNVKVLVGWWARLSYERLVAMVSKILTYNVGQSSLS
jgi:hypothetical protein